MAYPLSASTILEVIINGTHANQRVMSVFHYKYTGTASITDGAAAIASLLGVLTTGTTLYSRYRDVMGLNWVCNEVTGQAIYPQRFIKQGLVPSLTAGAGDSDANSTATAVCITRRADEATRSGHGTIHLPAVPDIWQEAGNVQADAVPKYILLGTQMGATVTIGGTQAWTPVIYHRNPPSASKVITQTSVQRTLRTERRRVVGRGI